MSESATTLAASIDLDRGEELLQFIRNRRSVGKVTDQIPDRALIWQMLEAATWAPNHHLTEPWRFFVHEGEARARLGETMGAVASSRELNPERREQVAQQAASKPLRAPYVIGVAAEPSDSAPDIEEIAAACAAVQNMLLGAEALGLAAIWRSGWITFEPEIRAHFGLSDRAQMLGFVYVGYPAMEPPTRVRRSPAEVTVWLES